MMNQSVIIGLLAMLSLSSTFIDAKEELPRLRNSFQQEVLSAEKQEEDDHPEPESGCFKVDKSMSCEGGFKKEKGAGKMCKGQIKANFSAKAKSEDVVNDIATELLSQIVLDSSGFLPNTKDAFVPQMTSDDDGAMETMLSWDNMSNDELLAMMMMNKNDAEVDAIGGEDDEFFSKTVQFGGFIKAGWGCKASIKMDKKDGKFTKTADCGFKGGAGMGPGPKTMDDHHEGDEIDEYLF